MTDERPAYEQSDAAVEMVLRKHLPVPFPGSDVVLCLCDVRRSYDGPIGHRLHIAAELRKAGCSVTEPTAPRSGSVTDRLDAVSRALSRAGGMAVAAGHFDLATLIGEAGCDLDDIIDDLLEAEGATADSAPQGQVR